MEFALIGLLIIPYLVFRFYKKSQFTPFERDKRRFSKGVQLYYEKDYIGAYNYFNDQILQTPKSAAAYYFRGKCEVKLQNISAALYDLSIALTYDNTVADIYIEKGKIHVSRKEDDKAFREFNKAVWYSHSTNAEALRLRGIAHSKQGLIFQAYEDLQKALQLGDEHANYLLQSYPFSDLRSRNNLL
jgi:tetratricopeptide (TPR) repeat protein